MRRGTRQKQPLCGCGCGQLVQPYINKKTGGLAYYPKYISGHGLKVYRDRVRAEFAAGLRVQPMKKKDVGTREVMTTGYIRIKCPDEVWRFEHRVVAGLRDGDGKVVHHKDGDRSNNSPDNLVIMTQGPHVREHLALPEGRWAINHTECRNCGGTDRKHGGHGFCSSCYGIYHRRRPKPSV